MKTFKRRQMEKIKIKVMENIQELEKKRKRSEFSIIDSLYREEELNPEDIKYFNKYTAEIKTLKEELKELNHAIDQLE